METNIEPTNYEIRVRGHLDERRMRWFEGLSVSSHSNGETIISGRILDQAALHGILNRIRDLGLPLLLVRRTDIKLEE
ncbi:MAG TPA: hypothetical protein VK897_08495 [Anaerolineales bacterium]|nr:hypothetical protein [Anaerolineales bacterium]